MRSASRIALLAAASAVAAAALALPLLGFLAWLVGWVGSSALPPVTPS